MNQDEILLEEWKEVRTSLRHFGSKRFAQLTVFIAAAGFMFAELLKPAAPHPAVRVLGIVFPLLFLLMEISSVRLLQGVCQAWGGNRGATLPTQTDDRCSSEVGSGHLVDLYPLWTGVSNLGGYDPGGLPRSVRLLQGVCQAWGGNRGATLPTQTDDRCSSEVGSGHLVDLYPLWTGVS